MMATPSRNTRTPSSARAVNVNVPAVKVNRPVQRTEKLSTGRPAGPPAPQSLLTAETGAARGGVRLCAMLLEYSAKNWPVGQPPVGAIVNVRGPEVWPSGLRTLTAAEPAAAMSAAGMLAIRRVAFKIGRASGRASVGTAAVAATLMKKAVRVNAALLS